MSLGVWIFLLGKFSDTNTLFLVWYRPDNTPLSVLMHPEHIHTKDRWAQWQQFHSKGKKEQYRTDQTCVCLFLYLYPPWGLIYLPLSTPSPQAVGHGGQPPAGPVHHGVPRLLRQRQQADPGTSAGAQQEGGEEVCGLRRDAGAGGVRRGLLRFQPLADERQRRGRGAAHAR